MIQSTHRGTLLAVVLSVIAATGSLAGSAYQFSYEGDSTGSDPTQYRESVSTLTNFDGFFPYNPSFGQQLDDWYVFAGTSPSFGLQGSSQIEGRANGTDYGTWIFGYIEAPLTGQYTFCIASADNSEFLLSTNYIPTNEVLVAYEPGTGNPLFSGGDLDTRESAPINLVQGQKYYFDVLQQVGPGPGYVQVGWIRPDGVQELIPALHLAQYEGYNYYNGFGPVQAPVFNVPGNGSHGGLNGGDIPTSASLVEGQDLLLQLDVIAQQPTTFVWTTNGVVVPGQNLSYFEIPRTPASYNGLQIQAVVSNTFGSMSSSICTVSVTPDTTPPTVVSADTAGSPDILEVTYSKPVDPVSSTNVANYQVTLSGGGSFAFGPASVTLSADQQTVTFTGPFNFGAGTNYSLTVRNVKDQASAPNLLSPNPTTVSFTLSAPQGTTYNFNSGIPSGVRLFGTAAIETSSDPTIGDYVALTDAAINENGAILLTTRNNIDQAHIKFNASIGSSFDAATGGSDGGDGFSVNISANLPLGTFQNPQFGYAPPVAEPQFTVYFNARPNGNLNPVEIGVSLNDVVLTNVPAGTNFTSLNGIPPIASADGHWAPVDINLQRDGTLNLVFDGVIVLTNFQTGWIGLDSAQVNIGAATEAWCETHYIANLYVNFYEGYVGNVGLAANSVLGGTFPEGSTVQLVAVPTGAGPDTYQWYNNGVAISGATNRVLTFPATVGSGGSFTLAISNSFSGLVSSPQSVIIQPNLNPPKVLSASAVAGSINKIFLQFDQTLDTVSATAPSTYSSPYFGVNSVALGKDGESVIITTSQQRYGVNYPLTISGLKDTYASENVLNTNITITSGLSYDDEVLGDLPVRYYKLNETNGTIAYTLTTGGDTVNTNGTYQGLPILGVPGLVPSAVNDTAVTFLAQAGNSNQVAVPNNGDINITRGPWYQRTIELWFNANGFPIGAQPGDSAINAQTHAVAGLWEEGGNLRDIGIYLWNNTGITNQLNTNPPTGLLCFTAYNSTDDGPGSPFGLLQFPPVYVTYPVSTGVTYHVVGVLDGDPNGTTGELRLYVNGQLAGRTTNGVGQIYDHNGSVHIAGGNGRSHLNVSGIWSYLNGTEQDVSIYNSVLSSNDILAHYQAGIGTSLTATTPPTYVLGVDPHGDPYRLTVTFNQPVSPQTATNLSSYVLQTSGGNTLSFQSASLASDLATVSLNLKAGSSFAAGNNYNLTVSSVADILSANNIVATTNLTFTFSSAGAVAISASSSLGNETVVENQAVQFSVAATGQTPYAYQWLYDGAPLPGQTNSTLSFAAAWNSGGNYSVIVSNQFSAITSSPPSVLTVLPDTSSPKLAGLRGLAGTLNEIVLTFNKPVDPSTATNLSTYGVPTAVTTGLSLLGASISTNGLQVTLATTQQIHGQTNQITITNLKDRSHVPNTHTTAAQFVSTISYRDEVLAEPGLVRYWTFDQTNGTAFPSLVSKYDISPLNIVGTIKGDTNLNAVPILGVPGLVPDVPNNTAIAFNGLGGTNRIELPNGADINSTLGPWYQVTTLFSFKANGLPYLQITSTATNYQAPVIFSDYQFALYLYPTQTSSNPSQAQLVFESEQTSSLGVGSPWGGNTAATATRITYNITTNTIYNVAAVLDGNSGFVSGELRLYINGVRVGTVTGIGAVYPNPNDPPGFGQGYVTTYTGQGKTINPELVTATTSIDEPLNGVIDEFAYINQGTLTDARIAQLYAFSQTNWADPGFIIVTNTTTASQPNISFASVSGGTLNLNWPSGSTGYYLEYTTNLASGVWFSNPVSPTTVNGTNYVSQPIGAGGNEFFRLYHP